MRRLLEDGLIYYSWVNFPIDLIIIVGNVSNGRLRAIFAVTGVLTIMIIAAPPGLKNITAQCVLFNYICFKVCYSGIYQTWTSVSSMADHTSLNTEYWVLTLDYGHELITRLTVSQLNLMRMRHLVRIRLFIMQVAMMSRITLSLKKSVGEFQNTGGRLELPSFFTRRTWMNTHNSSIQIIHPKAGKDVNEEEHQLEEVEDRGFHRTPMINVLSPMDALARPATNLPDIAGVRSTWGNAWCADDLGTIDEEHPNCHL